MHLTNPNFAESVPSEKIQQLSSGTGLGQYSSTGSCVADTGATVIGQRSHSGALPNVASTWTVLIGFLVTALTTKLI